MKKCEFQTKYYHCAKDVLIVLVKETTCNKEGKQLNFIKHQNYYHYCTTHTWCMGSVFLTLRQSPIADVSGASCFGEGDHSKEGKYRITLSSTMTAVLYCYTTYILMLSVICMILVSLCLGAS